MSVRCCVSFDLTQLMNYRKKFQKLTDLSEFKFSIVILVFLLQEKKLFCIRLVENKLREEFQFFLTKIAES